MGDSLEEASLVTEALGREYEVAAVERVDAGGLDVTLLDLGEISGKRVVISVMPESTKIDIWSSRRAVAAGLLVGREKNLLIIIYSRRGKLLKTSYLFLGYMAYHSGFDVVVVNGSPREVREVLDELSIHGKIVVKEDRLYPVKP